MEYWGYNQSQKVTLRLVLRILWLWRAQISFHVRYLVCICNHKISIQASKSETTIQAISMELSQILFGKIASTLILGHWRHTLIMEIKLTRWLQLSIWLIQVTKRLVSQQLCGQSSHKSLRKKAALSFATVTLAMGRNRIVQFMGHYWRISFWLLDLIQVLPSSQCQLSDWW